jgi:hypothetical protein
MSNTRIINKYFSQNDRDGKDRSNLYEASSMTSLDRQRRKSENTDTYNTGKNNNNNPIQALFRNRFQSLSRSSSIPIHEIEYQKERDTVSIVTPTSSSQNQYHNTPFEQWSVTATDNTSIVSTFDQSRDADIGEDFVLPLTPDKQKVQIPRMTEKIVLFPSDPPSFSEALQLWLNACNQLMTSDEMNRLLQSSGAVVCCAGELVVRTATLPVRVPVLITCGAIDVSVIW